MKKTNPIYQVTAGNPKKLKKPVIWTVVTNINLFSFMFLALFVITIYSFFAGDAGSLDIKTLWLSWGGILATSMTVTQRVRTVVSASQSISANCL